MIAVEFLDGFQKVFRFFKDNWDASMNQHAEMLPLTKNINNLIKARKPHQSGIPLVKTLSEELVIKLLKQEHGNISRCADIVGTCRGTLRRMIDNNPTLQDTLKQCRERQLDTLEQSCFDRAMDSNA